MSFVHTSLASCAVCRDDCSAPAHKCGRSFLLCNVTYILLTLPLQSCPQCNRPVHPFCGLPYEHDQEGFGQRVWCSVDGKCVFKEVLEQQAELVQPELELQQVVVTQPGNSESASPIQKLWCAQGNHYCVDDQFVNRFGKRTKTCVPCLLTKKKNSEGKKARTDGTIGEPVSLPESSADETALALEDFAAMLSSMRNSGKIELSVHVDMEMQNEKEFEYAVRDAVVASTGFHFIESNSRILKSNNNVSTIWLHCSQDVKHELPTKKSEKPGTKNREHVKMDRFECCSSLRMQTNLYTHIASIKITHLHHPKYVDVRTEDHVIEYIRQHRDDTPQNIFHKISQTSKNLTEAQVYRWWQDINRQNWRRADDPIESARILLKENADTILYRYDICRSNTVLLGRIFDCESLEKRVPSGLSNETDEEKRMRSEFIDYLENNVGFTTDAMKARLANMSRRCAGDRKKFDFYDNALRAANDFAHMTPDAMRRSMVEYVGGRPPLAKDTMEFFARHLKHDKKMHPKAAALVIPKQITPRGKAGPTAVPKKRVQCHHCGKIGHLQKE